MTMAMSNGSRVESFPPLFGVRRPLEFPTLERIHFPAGDGAALCLHHTSGGERGPVLMTPGTAMTALTYCVDSVPRNIVEFLVAKGFDVWLFDWRTSPLLDSHERPYTLDDVARYDWPAAVAEVRHRTGRTQVSILAHCLSAPCLLLSLLRGYLPRDHVRAFVASQVALHLKLTPVEALKIGLRLDRLLPDGNMIHQQPAQITGQLSDFAVSILAAVLPRSFSCDNRACYRHVASFGELVLHSRIDPVTHALMGELVPECITAFLKDVAVWVRHGSVLTDEDLLHLDRLRLPIHFISGQENRMFVPESTALTHRLLCEANGAGWYERTVYPDFGHLDSYFGKGAAEAIWPDIARTLATDDAVTARIAPSASLPHLAFVPDPTAPASKSKSTP
jgi:cholesterol oxidase